MSNSILLKSQCWVYEYNAEFHLVGTLLCFVKWWVSNSVCVGGGLLRLLTLDELWKNQTWKREGQQIERKGSETGQKREGHWRTRSNSERIGCSKWQSITILNILSKSNLLRSCQRPDICTLLGSLPYILRSQPPNLPALPFTHKAPVHLSFFVKGKGE